MAHAKWWRLGSSGVKVLDVWWQRVAFQLVMIDPRSRDNLQKYDNKQATKWALENEVLGPHPEPWAHQLQIAQYRRIAAEAGLVMFDGAVYTDAEAEKRFRICSKWMRQHLDYQSGQHVDGVLGANSSYLQRRVGDDAFSRLVAENTNLGQTTGHVQNERGYVRCDHSRDHLPEPAARLTPRVNADGGARRSPDAPPAEPGTESDEAISRALAGGWPHGRDVTGPSMGSGEASARARAVAEENRHREARAVEPREPGTRRGPVRNRDGFVNQDELAYDDGWAEAGPNAADDAETAIPEEDASLSEPSTLHADSRSDDGDLTDDEDPDAFKAEIDARDAMAQEQQKELDKLVNDVDSETTAEQRDARIARILAADAEDDGAVQLVLTKDNLASRDVATADQDQTAAVEERRRDALGVLLFRDDLEKVVTGEGFEAIEQESLAAAQRHEEEFRQVDELMQRQEALPDFRNAEVANRRKRLLGPPLVNGGSIDDCKTDIFFLKDLFKKFLPEDERAGALTVGGASAAVSAISTWSLAPTTRTSQVTSRSGDRANESSAVARLMRSLIIEHDKKMEAPPYVEYTGQNATYLEHALPPVEGGTHKRLPYLLHPDNEQDAVMLVLQTSESLLELRIAHEERKKQISAEQQTKGIIENCNVCGGLFGFCRTRCPNMVWCEETQTWRECGRAAHHRASCSFFNKLPSRGGNDWRKPENVPVEMLRQLPQNNEIANDAPRDLFTIPTKTTKPTADGRPGKVATDLTKFVRCKLCPPPFVKEEHKNALIKPEGGDPCELDFPDVGVPYEGSVGPYNGSYSFPTCPTRSGKLEIPPLAKEFPKHGEWAGMDRGADFPERPSLEFIASQQERAERLKVIENSSGAPGLEDALADEVKRLGVTEAARLQGIRGSEEEVTGYLGVTDEVREEQELRGPCPMYGKLNGCMRGSTCPFLHDRGNLNKKAGCSWCATACTNCGGWMCPGGGYVTQFCKAKVIGGT